MMEGKRASGGGWLGRPQGRGGGHKKNHMVPKGQFGIASGAIPRERALAWAAGPPLFPKVSFSSRTERGRGLIHRKRKPLLFVGP